MSVNKILNKIFKRKRNTMFRNNEKVREIDYKLLKELLRENIDIKLIDVRSPQEFAEKRIEGATNIPLDELRKKASILLQNKDMMIIIYCACGIRSKKAYSILNKIGYKNLYCLKGGLNNIEYL